MLERILITFVDFLFSLYPSFIVKKEKYTATKIIAHRGCHNNKTILENTLPAFEKALSIGVWGIEYDIRFTLDNVPVVHHDSSLFRVFRKPEKIENLTFVALKKHCPEVPELSKIIERFPNVHHMIEIKTIPSELNDEKAKIIKALLKGLEAAKDYHLLSLELDTFQKLSAFPKHCFLPVGEWRLKEYSQAALTEDYAGIAGHPLLMKKKWIDGHLSQNKRIGTGQIASFPSMSREVNRGVEWIFTNKPVLLQKRLNHVRV